MNSLPTVIATQLRETYSVLYLSCKHSVRHPDRTPPAIGTPHSCDACGPVMVADGTCELCGQPMPPGEEIFKYHGYSGPCPVAPAGLLDGVARAAEESRNESNDRPRSPRGTANERGRLAKNVIK